VGLAVVGLTSTVAQIVLMRELVATFYGNELLFGLTLAAWLAWVALGSWGGARLAGSRRSTGRTFALGLALAGALLPAQIALVRDARRLLGVVPGAFVEFGPMVAAVVLSLAPLCLLGGFLFTLGARLTVEQGGTAGRAYVWESTGAVAGGAFFSFVLIRWLDPFQTALLVSAVNWAAALQRLVPGAWRLRLSLGALLLLALAALPLGRFLHRATLAWQWADLVFAADSPYGRLTIQARGGQRAFFENGLLAFETQGTFPEEVAHFPLLAHPDPRSVLLIGGGVAGDLREILRHPVARVTYVELDPLLIEAARSFLPPGDAVVLDDARVTLALTDGRRYVSRCAERAGAATRCAFDVVILDVPEPATGALNRFYTYEFFEQVHATLNPGGVFALGLPSAENYWSPELARRNGSVYQTLRAVFPQVVVLPGEHNFFLASEAPLEVDPGLWAGRLAGRGVETRWVTPSYIEYVLTTDRFAQVRASLQATTGVRINRDLRPICYYYDLALWLSRFYPNLRQALTGAGLVNLGWVAAPLLLAVLFVRWRRALAVPFAVAGIGLAEMTLEVVILFAFQVSHGTVYAGVSLIVTAFMAGLALGGAAGNRLLARRGAGGRGPGGDGPVVSFLCRRRWCGAGLALTGVVVAVALYSAVLPLILSLSVPPPPPAFYALAVLAGALTGMAFPVAVSLMPGGAGSAAGLLYGADLVGGCLGALVGAGLLVPLLGIPQTCAAIALVGLAGLLALL